MISRSNPRCVAAPIGRYSHLTVVPAHTDLLFLAGQVGMRPDGTIPDSVDGQYVQALRNVMAILESEDCGPEDIVRVNSFLVEPLDLKNIASIRTELLGDVEPSSTLVYVPRLAAPCFLVEIEVTAARPANQGAAR